MEHRDVTGILIDVIPWDTLTATMATKERVFGMFRHHDMMVSVATLAGNLLHYNMITTNTRTKKRCTKRKAIQADDEHGVICTELQEREEVVARRRGPHEEGRGSATRNRVRQALSTVVEYRPRQGLYYRNG